MKTNNKIQFLILIIFTQLFFVEAFALTVDEEFKAAGPDSYTVGDHTRDACDSDDDVSIKSTDGSITLFPRKTIYFTPKEFDSYTRSGGWYWKCGISSEKSRFDWWGYGKYVMAIRKSNGVIDWYQIDKIKKQPTVKNINPAVNKMLKLKSNMP